MSFSQLNESTLARFSSVVNEEIKAIGIVQNTTRKKTATYGERCGRHNRSAPSECPPTEKSTLNDGDTQRKLTN